MDKRVQAAETALIILGSSSHTEILKPQKEKKTTTRNSVGNGKGQPRIRNNPVRKDAILGTLGHSVCGSTRLVELAQGIHRREGRAGQRGWACGQGFWKRKTTHFMHPENTPICKKIQGFSLSVYPFPQTLAYLYFLLHLRRPFQTHTFPQREAWGQGTLGVI
jgi:hypothetical protein